MLDPRTTTHDDLRSGTGPWRPGLQRPPGRPLERDMRCDVAIVGAGITGAFLAEHLSARGLEVVVIDREREGFGSTAASTAMLQWEIDLSLRDLAALYGFERAAEIYRLSFEAVGGLARLVGELALPCGFARRETVYLAAGEIGPRELIEEAALRERAGLPGQYLEHAALLSGFGFDRAGAIVSPGSAEADPLCLCHGLLAAAARRGARLVRDEVVAYDDAGRAAAVSLSGGATVEAAHLVLATGYVMPDCVSDDLHEMASSWAIATVPQPPQALWRGRALVWEASRDYCYSRTTPDGRIIFGGGETYSRRDPADIFAFVRRHLLKVYPALAGTRIDHAWGGTLAVTVNRLPFLRRVRPGIYAASGYSGQGVALAPFGGKIIAEAILGNPGRLDSFAALPCPRFPGGKLLRWPALVAGMSWYALRDRI